MSERTVSIFPMSIRHSTGCHVFLADVDDRLGYLQYETADGRFIVEHTFVPPNGRGRGIGESLVRAAVDEAHRTHQRMSFRCPFAAAIARRHGWLRDAEPAEVLQPADVSVV